MTNVLVGGKSRKTVLEDHLDRLRNAEPDRNVQGGGESTAFSIEDCKHFFRINGVSHNNQLYQVDYTKTPILNKGKFLVLKQDEWVERNLGRIAHETQYRGFRLGSAPFYMSIWNTLYNNVHHPTYGETAVTMLLCIDNYVREHPLMTMTRATYTPNGPDSVTHDYGNPFNTKTVIPGMLPGALPGPHAPLSSFPNGKYLAQNLFGFDAKRVDELLTFFNPGHAFFERKPLPVKVQTEAPLLFGYNKGVTIQLDKETAGAAIGLIWRGPKVTGEGF